MTIEGCFTDETQRKAFEKIIDTLENMPMKDLCTLAISANVAILKKWNQKKSA